MNSSASLSSLPSYLSLRSFIATKAVFSLNLYLAQVSKTLNIRVVTASEGVISTKKTGNSSKYFIGIIQSSFLENALIKAKHGSLHSGKYTIADDSGLVIPKLDYEPGIFSARYAGSDASDKDNRNKVIQELNNLSLENLDAYYVCCLVGIRNHDDPMPIISYGKINGKVSVHSSGEGGFGYDKIFYPSDFDCSMASIDIKVKNTISHRAIAVKDFINKFKAASS